ncbi:MAG: AI-2E family transporter, partial [Gammaproteobacteria bacterium]|nr:AI-2E family transporter [Gammaproteobacteria bacterium]
MDVISRWFQRYFSDPQAVFLAVFLIVIFSIIVFMGDMLMPALAAVVIAYLLEGLVLLIERRDARRLRVVILVFMIFMSFLMFLLFGVIPLVWTQAVDLARELPNYINQGQAALLRLPEHYAFISEQQVNEVINNFRGKIAGIGQNILSLSLSSIPGVITLLVYLILVPLLVFFFLKDKQRLIQWFCGFLPS